MPIPDFQSFMRPLLACGADGSEQNIRDCINRLSEQFHLSEEERAQTVPSGHETIVANRVHWARTYLDKAGALTRTRRSHFQTTERGMRLLKEYTDRIDVKVLKQFPEFIAFHAPKKKIEDAPTLDKPEEETSTPDERITEALSEISAKLQADLLSRIAENSPAFFERLVVDLVVAMGYGGTRENVVQRIGRSGDEGIDGIVNEDPLGLDVVYIQAKRYAADQTIGRDKIQQFAGALVGQGANKGVFVATCSFSKQAIEYAQRVPQRIILIDGEELAKLLIRYGVGVRSEQTVQISKIDLDYFEDADS